MSDRPRHVDTVAAAMNVGLGHLAAHIVIRAADGADEPFLRALTGAARAAEFAAAGLPAEFVRPLLDQQFELQHRHYRSAWPQAEFLVVLERGRPVGRLTVAAGADEIRLIDLALSPEARNRGLGSALLGALIGHARESGVRRVALTVLAGNDGARRLYQRLGFRLDPVVAPDAVALPMTLRLEPAPRAAPGPA